MKSFTGPPLMFSTATAVALVVLLPLLVVAAGVYDLYDRNMEAIKARTRNANRAKGDWSK